MSSQSDTGFASRCLVAASNGSHSPFSGFPNLSLASATSYLQQQLTITESQWLSNSLTHKPNLLTDSLVTNSPPYSISARTA
jgi:hypothetical protein